MHEARLVNALQAVHERKQNAEQVILARQAPQVVNLLQTLALLVFHDHVGGAVGLEDAVHQNDVRVAKLRESLRLVDETVEPPAESVGVLVGDRMNGAVRRTHGEIGG